MKDFDHLNVLSLIGVSIDAGESPYIVMPYMANGSLLSYLKKERPNLTIAVGSDEDMVSTVCIIPVDLDAIVRSNLVQLKVAPAI